MESMLYGLGGASASMAVVLHKCIYLSSNRPANLLLVYLFITLYILSVLCHYVPAQQRGRSTYTLSIILPDIFCSTPEHNLKPGATV